MFKNSLKKWLIVAAFVVVPCLAQADVNPWQYQSPLAQQVNPQNFSPSAFVKLAVAGTSASVKFTAITGTIRPTFVISNKGSNGAYIAWGVGSATAVAATTSPQPYGHYIPAGVVETLDLQSSTGPTDTVAAIQDGGSTTLEISYGQGQ